jgi:phytoene dehydrogenase-like protein
MSERPLLEIRVPTLENPGLAPAGHHVFSILVHFAPYDLEGGWSPDAKEGLLRRVLERLEVHFDGVEPALVGSQVLSPADLEAEYRLEGGHLLHGEEALDQLAIRPVPECYGYRTPFSGLWLCGSGSHPGGGVTCAPGALAAKAILRG